MRGSQIETGSWASYRELDCCGRRGRMARFSVSVLERAFPLGAGGASRPSHGQDPNKISRYPTKSTMAKRLRSSTSELDSERASVGRKLPRIEPNDHASYSTPPTHGLGAIVASVKRVLENAQEGVWLRILPLEDDNGSLYYHTQQEWADRLPCLQKPGFLKPVDGKLQVQEQIWKFHFESDKYEIGTYCPYREGSQRGKKAYFIAKRPPTKNGWMYSNPQRQIEDKFAVRPKRIGNQGNELKDFFLNCRVALLNTKIQESRMNDKTEEVEEASTASPPVACPVAPLAAARLLLLRVVTLLPHASQRWSLEGQTQLQLAESMCMRSSKK